LYKGWQVAIAGLTINLLTGVITSWSIISTALIRDFSWAPPQAALPYSIFLFCYAPSMLIAGRAQDKLGPRIVVTAGIIIISLSTLMSSFLLTPAGIIIAWGVLWGLGLGGIFASLTPAAIKWFPPEKKALIAGVVVFGMGSSAFVMAPLLYYLILAIGLKNTFLTVGLILLVIGLILVRFIENPPANLFYNEEDQLEQDGPQVKMIFKKSNIYLLWLLFFLTTGVGMTLIAHLDNIALEQFDFTKGFMVVSSFSLFNAIGRIIFGLISSKIGLFKTSLLLYAAKIVSLLGLLFIGSIYSLVLFSSLLGFCHGGLFCLFPAKVSNLYGDDNFGLLYGFVFTALGVTGIFPMITSFIYANYGNFYFAFWVLLCSVAAALVITWFFKDVLYPKHEKP